jgi:hypothetical protein
MVAGEIRKALGHAVTWFAVRAVGESVVQLIELECTEGAVMCVNSAMLACNDKDIVKKGTVRKNRYDSRVLRHPRVQDDRPSASTPCCCIVAESHQPLKSFLRRRTMLPSAYCRRRAHLPLEDRAQGCWNAY